jgi:circadian clock protein KaiB
MSKRKPVAASVVDRVGEFEKAVKRGAAEQRYVLRLYVTGSTPRSSRAIQNIRSLCETHLWGRYDLEVIDIHQQPVLARGQQIIAAPTLIKQLPAPLRKMVGDLSDTQRVLMGLDLQPAPTSGEIP